jgi:hypothetical protein
MPRLAVFTICEKVIIDDAGMASLICLFTDIGAAVPPLTEMPPNAVAPKEWAIFSAWEWEDGDEGKEYSLFFEVRYPDGKTFAEGKATFVMQKDKRNQVKIPFVGIPVAQQGKCTVRIRLKHGDSLIIEPAPVYIKIGHLPAAPTLS